MEQVEQKEETIKAMMVMFENFNQQIATLNERKQVFETSYNIADNCSELLKEYVFFLGKKQHLAIQAAKVAAAAQAEQVEDVGEGAEAKIQLAIISCLNPMVTNKSLTTALLTSIISMSNRINNTNTEIHKIIKDSIRDKKFTLEDATKIFGFNIFKRNNTVLSLQLSAKDALKRNHPSIFNENEKAILVLEFASLWNGKDINLEELRQEQEQYLQEQQRQEQQRSWVVIKSAGVTGKSFPKMTAQERKITIDRSSVRWFDTADNAEKGSFLLSDITGVSDAGTWNSLFGVGITYTGGGPIYLWTSQTDRDRIQQFLTSKKGGKKHRKMTILHRKRRHQNKKKTRKNKNKKLTKKNRFIKK